MGVPQSLMHTEVGLLEGDWMMRATAGLEVSHWGHDPEGLVYLPSNFLFTHLPVGHAGRNFPLPTAFYYTLPSLEPANYGLKLRAKINLFFKLLDIVYQQWESDRDRHNAVY